MGVCGRGAVWVEEGMWQDSTDQGRSIGSYIDEGIMPRWYRMGKLRGNSFLSVLPFLLTQNVARWGAGTKRL